MHILEPETFEGEITPLLPPSQLLDCRLKARRTHRSSRSTQHARRHRRGCPWVTMHEKGVGYGEREQ